MKSNVLECENWELLREEGDENFSIERSVDEYRKNCLKATAYAQSAQLIKELLTKHKIDRAASMGIGKGVLEWHLKRCMPDLYLIGTDYTEGALQLLRDVFVECDELKTFDVLRDSYRGGVNADCLILYRVSTEFDFDDWCRIFKRMYEEGIKNVVFVPTELLNVKLLLFETLCRVRNKVRGKRETFCGYMYSEAEFKKMFAGNKDEPLYRIEDRIPISRSAVYFLERC